MARILEEAENLKLERIATVKTNRGEEVLYNVDRAICALADFLSDFDNERRMGWTLDAGWSEDEIIRLRKLALSTPSALPENPPSTETSHDPR